MIAILVLASLGGGCNCADDDGDGDGEPDAAADAAADAGRDADACCPSGGTCCPAEEQGYADGVDRCAAAGSECPSACVACTEDQWCRQATAQTPEVCVDECLEEQRCAGERVCCPTGVSCYTGECLLPDLTIDAGYITESMRVQLGEFDADSCEIEEGCVGAPGGRLLLRFGLRTPNIGEGDLHFGVPGANPLFEYSSCHRHDHFNGYARYRLLDADGDEVAPGQKRAFCLEDYEPIADDAPRALYSCFYQGIQAGWADTYVAGLDCQWIDVTGVAPGDYFLEATVNFDRLIAESSYDNNTARVPVTIQPSSCPHGCTGDDPACCVPGDPCGWALNGSCDCFDAVPWDSIDCSFCTLENAGCPRVGSCPFGCPDFEPDCCAGGDPCGYAGDGYCDCNGTADWDGADCDHCLADDPNCPG